MRASKKVSMSPMAITSAGEVIVNVAMSNGSTVPKELLARALATGGKVFIGVVLDRKEVMTAMKWADDSTMELSAWLWGDRMQRRRKRGWTSETVSKFCIGFDDGTVGAHLLASGYTVDELVAIGVFFRVSDLAVTHFANRVTFSYLDKEGRSVYFAARATELTEKWKDPKTGEPEDPPKYLKSKVHKEDDDGISPDVVNVVWSTHEKGKHRFWVSVTAPSSRPSTPRGCGGWSLSGCPSTT